MPDALMSLLTGGVLGLGWWAMLAVLLVFTQITIFSVTLYLHRSQAHRGVDFHPALAHVFRFWLWLTTSMITREWVAIHRKHHAKVETEDDPHSPVTRGIGTVFWHGVELYREARGMRADIEQYGRGTPDDAIERHLYTPHATLGPVLLLAINSVLFGLPGVALWAIQMAWIPFWAAGVVNGLGHWWGYRNYESADTSTNLTPWGFWIGGEELHNNHHAFPSSALCDAALGVRHRLECDPPAAGAAPGQGAAGGTGHGRAPEHRRARCRDPEGAAVAPLPGDDRLPAQRVHAGPARGSRPRRAKLRRLLPRRLRRGLVNDGRWLKPDSRAQLSEWVAQRPRIRTLVEYRARLAALLEARGHDAAERLHQLQAWCREAEESGIAALQAYAARLKGYSLVGA
jgi:stearoyl-CoA desaturase (delta-9 desaturase)